MKDKENKKPVCPACNGTEFVKEDNFILCIKCGAIYEKEDEE
ncbi:MAG TPA: hypothetical protein P5191_13090 [Ruminococcus sp.]|nr:hypothetical protein [Ruminococcus sp.]